MALDKAFILGAGLGTRLRPLTDHCPKPLVEVSGRSLLERTLDHFDAAGVTDCVVNTHYLPDQIEDRVSRLVFPRVSVSYEPELLDTGGGVKKVLSFFDEESFYVLSGDGLWEDPVDGEASALSVLAAAWRPDDMDILMLLQPVSSMHLTRGVGDYDLEASGQAVRSLNRHGSYMFTSIRINHPRIFEDTPEGAFSYLNLMDTAQRKGRLYGVVYEGDWHHISTPEDLQRVEDAFNGG